MPYAFFASAPLARCVRRVGRKIKNLQEYMGAPVTGEGSGGSDYCLQGTKVPCNLYLRMDILLILFILVFYTDIIKYFM